MPPPSTTPNPLHCFAVTTPGLEPVTARELEGLGIARGALAVERGGVSWTGDAATLCAANVWLRTASRVLVRVGEFRATAFWELERRARPLPWERWLAPGAEVQVRATCRKSRLYHSDGVAQRVLEAAMHRVTGLRAGAVVDDEEGELPESADATQLVVARIAHDVVTLSVDASGALLHRRGYRQAIAKAPLRETMAAAMLLAVGWDGSSALLDPMCGSGTIPIEGALIARRIAPGLARAQADRFALLRWPSLDRGAWRTVVEQALESVRPAAAAPIVGSDRDEGAVAAARGNAERAGVGGDVIIEKRALSAVEAPAPEGWLVSNPPYGIRVSEGAAVRDLWARVGQLARERLDGWRIALLSPDAALDRQTRLPLRERLRTVNGGIAVRLVSTA